MSARYRCVAVLVGVAGLLVTSCSNDSTVSVVDDRDPQPSTLAVSDLQAAAASASELTDIEMTMEMTLDGESVMSMSMVSSGDSARMSIEADESFLGTTDESEFDDAEFDLESFPTSGEMIAIGEQVYVRGLFAAGFLMFGGADADVDGWYEVLATDDLDGEYDGTEEFFGEMDAATEEAFDFLDILDNAFGEVTELGREEIGGADTTHYQVFVDADGMEALLEEMWGEDLGAEDLGDTDTDSEVGAVVDLWIDDDGLLRQIVSSEDTADGRVEFRITIAPADDVTIEAPADATPIDPTSMFDELFGEFGDEFGEGFDGAVDEFEELLPSDEELESFTEELEQSLAELEDAFGGDVPGTEPGQ